MADRDPSAAGERTFLAWHRSALTTVVVAAVLVRTGDWVAASLTFVVAAALEVVGMHRLRSLHDSASLPPPLSPATMRLVAAAVVLVATGAALSV